MLDDVRFFLKSNSVHFTRTEITTEVEPQNFSSSLRNINVFMKSTSDMNRKLEIA
jgi:hypothetical protein